LKTIVLALFVYVISFTAFAEYKIEQLFENGEYLDGHVSLFLDNGEIVHFSKNSSELLSKARSAFENERQIEITKVSNSSSQADLITDIYNPADKQLPVVLNTQKEMYSHQRFNEIRFSSQNALEHAGVTKVATYNDAQSLMDQFNGETDEDSQCYNRAHMWSYESLVKNKVSLGKIWIFFTKKYIRENKYKWWFHIAPYTEVAADGQKYILDRGFTLIPYNVQNWKNLFITTKANCPVITKYSEYSKNQYAEDCYLMYSSQYYWQPWQLKSLERKGYRTWGYKQKDLRITYRNALTKWDGHIPELLSTDEAPIENTPVVISSGNPVEENTVEVNNSESILESEPSSDYELDFEANTSTLNNRNTNINAPLRVGDTVFNVAKNVKVRVLEVASNGVFKILFLEGTLAGKEGNNWGRSDLALMSGCHNTLCVGNITLNTSKESVASKIVGLQTNGDYVIEYLEGTLKGKIGSHWSKKELAATSGCSYDLCTGVSVLNVSKNATKSRIVGIEANGNYVIEFLEGRSKGLKGSNWGRKDFAVMTGCNSNLCVGDSAVLTGRNAKVTIVGIQQNNLFVIRFETGSNTGRLGSNWDRGDLVKNSD
jgi:hypothetical protein